MCLCTGSISVGKSLQPGPLELGFSEEIGSEEACSLSFQFFRAGAGNSPFYFASASNVLNESNAVGFDDLCMSLPTELFYTKPEMS